MQTVVLIVHLFLALSLIGVVLLQRSEGGGLGMGGGGGAMGARASVTPLAKLTWGLAVAFIVTSLTLTILAARGSATSSVIDRLGATATEVPAATAPAAPPAEDLLPPPASDGASDGAPLLPPRAD